MTSNVFIFKKPIAASSSGGAALRGTATCSCLASARISEIRNAQAQLKEDIRVTVLMLDLAVAYARRVAIKSDDLQVRMDIDQHLASIEDLLDVARQKAIAL